LIAEGITSAGVPRVVGIQSTASRTHGRHFVTALTAACVNASTNGAPRVMRFARVM
jgi:hypothetical protein